MFEAGWRHGYGADADHLKTPADIDETLATGYTFFTIGPGDMESDGDCHRRVSGCALYTSNLVALPMIGGLLKEGMQPAAALAVLIAGLTTALPAIAAVSGLVQKRAFALVGALFLGYAYQMVSGF